MVKKSIITATLVTGFASAALANAPTVTLSGSLDTQYGYVSEKKEFRHESPIDLTSNKRRNHALVNNAKIRVRADGKSDCGVGYGGLVVLNSDTSADKLGDTENAQQTMAYIESKAGRIEAGSYTGVSNTLQVNATQIAKGAAYNGDMHLWINPLAGSTTGINEDFLLLPGLYTNNTSLVSVKQVNASKINLYTPEYAGLRFGFTYTPDMESYGTISKASSILVKEAAQAGAYRDIIEGGVHYSGKANNFALKAALLGQSGNAKTYSSTVYRRLRAWEAGLSLSFANFTLAGAYGDLGKSGQIKNGTGRSSKYWNIGGAAENGPFGLSVTYGNTHRGIDGQAHANTLQTVAAGADYRLAKGIKVYANATHFEFKDKASNPSNKGQHYLLGSELAF